jgi:hypothetical protein
MAHSKTAGKILNQRPRAQREMEGPHAAEMSRDLMEYLREYARENPEATALWCLGIGFILGWKLKPW